jgi:hypothetical protein
VSDLEALQELFAEYATRPGARRIITQEVLKERCQHYMEVAKKELEACGPEESNDTSEFCPVVTVFGPRGEEGNIPVGFKGMEEKHARMYAISETCRTTFSQAIILRVVGTTVNMDEIAKAMELNPPRTFQQLDYLHEKMRKWMKAKYNSTRFAELPPALRHDFIIVSGMGPTLEDCGVICMYRWENGKLIFEAERMEMMQMRNEMVPRWWE